jgi:hypothetical protein
VFCACLQSLHLYWLGFVVCFWNTLVCAQSMIRLVYAGASYLRGD